ncbi:hypothetical protein SDC9_140251 [bioreactor metagenome]|uniref:Uncharacterized protein n=1 Tax=bioreactor metagenome TaxID=1076179 RepID=A0A645DV03_9ZZZZ
MHHLSTREVVETDHHRQRRLGGARQHAHAAEVRLDLHRLDVLQHGLEDGRCAVGDGHTLSDHGVNQRLGVFGSVAARQHDLVGQQRGGLWQAPALPVEHGRDEHDAVVQRHAQIGGHGRGVQIDAAVRVVHALGLACGAGGIAGAVGRGFVDLGPVDLRVGGGQQVFVVQQRFQRGLDLVQRLVGHDNPALDLGRIRCDGFGKG